MLLDRAGYELIHEIHVVTKMSEMYQSSSARGTITMGYGWAVVPVNKKNNLSAADGSGGTFYARIIVFPLVDMALVGFTNSGNGNEALDFVVEKVTGLKWGG